MAHNMEKVDEIPPPSDVGRLFLLQYYMKWSENAANVHQFYGTESYFNHDGVEAVGQTAIQKAIDKLNYESCKTRIHSVLGCYGANESLVIVVGGELSHGGSAPRRFMQNFVLNKQASKRYWVQNDVFQWVDKMFFEAGSTPSSTPVSAPANQTPLVNEGDSEMGNVKPLENSSPPPNDNGVAPTGAAGGGGQQRGGGRGWSNGPPRYYNSHFPGKGFQGGGSGQSGGAGGGRGGHFHGRGGSFGSGRGRDNRDKYTRNHHNNNQQQQERA